MSSASSSQFTETNLEYSDIEPIPLPTFQRVENKDGEPDGGLLSVAEESLFNFTPEVVTLIENKSHPITLSEVNTGPCFIMTTGSAEIAIYGKQSQANLLSVDADKQQSYGFQIPDGIKFQYALHLGASLALTCKFRPRDDISLIQKQQIIDYGPMGWVFKLPVNQRPSGEFTSTAVIKSLMGINHGFIKRLFMIENPSTDKSILRGSHAHINNTDFLMTRGPARVLLFDGKAEKEHSIRAGEERIIEIRPGIWHEAELGPGATIIVASTSLFISENYIRSTKENFLAELNARNQKTN